MAFSASDLLTLFKHPKLLNTYRNYLEVFSSSYPDMNYIGLNFNSLGQLVSVKFYFAFFHRLTKEEILKFIPHTIDFDKYYHLWEESKIRSLEHTGCTFELKFKNSFEPTDGFHFRLKPIKESYDLIGYPEKISLNPLECGTRPGINFEYTGAEMLMKKYFYFEDQLSKDYIADLFQKPFAKKAALLEYTEAKDIQKVNIWRFDYSNENMSRPNYFEGVEKDVIEMVRNKYGLIPISDGFYKNDLTKAVYFFNTDNKNLELPFEEKENFNIDTLKLLVK
jgi:hypothetical protein